MFPFCCHGVMVFQKILLPCLTPGPHPDEHPIHGFGWKCAGADVHGGRDGVEGWYGGTTKQWTARCLSLEMREVGLGDDTLEVCLLKIFSGFRKRAHVSRTSWVEIDWGEDKNNRCKEMTLHQYYSYYCPVVFTFFLGHKVTKVTCNSQSVIYVWLVIWHMWMFIIFIHTKHTKRKRKPRCPCVFTRSIWFLDIRQRYIC